MRMGSFSRGLYLGVSVVLCHGISDLSSKGMPFSMSAIRFFRAYGDGVALMRVSISESRGMGRQQFATRLGELCFNPENEVIRQRKLSKLPLTVANRSMFHHPGNKQLPAQTVTRAKPYYFSLLIRKDRGRLLADWYTNSNPEGLDLHRVDDLSPAFGRSEEEGRNAASHRINSLFCSLIRRSSAYGLAVATCSQLKVLTFKLPLYKWEVGMFVNGGKDCRLH